VGNPRPVMRRGDKKRKTEKKKRRHVERRQKIGKESTNTIFSNGGRRSQTNPNRLMCKQKGAPKRQSCVKGPNDQKIKEHKHGRTFSYGGQKKHKSAGRGKC